MRTIDQINEEIKKLKERLTKIRGSPTEVYTRIVGYYRPLRGWNNGKRHEYDKRKLFNVRRENE
jgi:ribonucleoside-triphosphate reductase